MYRCLRPAIALPLTGVAYACAWAVAWLALSRMLRRPLR